MNNDKYKKLVKKHIKKENKIKNYMISFIAGGLLGSFSQIIFLLFHNIFHINNSISRSIISLFLIISSSFITSIGIYDKVIKYFRCGLIIPTTGFAHSITSSAIDSKKDGYIKGIGSNFFSLAGSVIVYAIIVSFVLILIKVIINA